MNKNYKRVQRTGILLASLFALTACGSGDGETADSQTLRFTNFDPEHMAGPQTKAMGESLQEDTDGRISFDYYWNGSLLPGPEVPSGIAGGTADIGLMLTAYTPEDFPIGDWSESLMSLPAMDHPAGILQSAATHADVVLSNEDILQEFSDQGLKVLAPVVPYSNFDLLCVDPVTDLESAEGKRVRVAGEVWADEAAALGMQPVNLEPGEIYEGLQRGVIDCVVHHPPGYIGNSTWEVAKHYTTVPFSGAMAYLVMSEDVWEGLSAEDQQAFVDASAVYFSEFEQKSLQDYAEFAEDGENEHDISWHEPDDALIDELQTHQEEARAGLSSDAPEALSDPDAYIEAYEDGMSDWSVKLETTNLNLEDFNDEATAYLEAPNMEISEYEDLILEGVFNEHATSE